MTQEIINERPAFTSVTVYNHPSGLLSFLYATEWQLEAGSGILPQVVLMPDPQDPYTRLVVEVKDVGQPIKPGDRPSIKQGVEQGLAQLPEGKIVSLLELDEQGRWGLEWHCTFLAEGARCQRRVRLFYSDHYQYSVTIQGSTEEKFSYWQGMLEFTLLTVATAPLQLANQENMNS